MRPTCDNLSTHNFGYKIKGTIVAYGIYVASVIILFLLLQLIDSLIIEHYFNHSIVEQMKLNKQSVQERFGQYTFLIIVLIGPFFEEILFRLPLRLEKSGIALSASIIIYQLLVEHFFTFEFNNPDSYGNVAIALIVFLLVLKFFPDSWLLMIKQKYSYYFYFVAIAFALIHVTNFAPYNSNVLLFYPLFTLPQFLMGLSIGFVRMEYGFFYGVALHSLINLPSVLFNI
jgi:hypothetical protein